MTHDSDNPSLRLPCATCMGFCIENTNCVRCSICINWFHQTCCKLSNRAFNELKSENPDVHFIENSDYICKFCTQLNSCDMCQLETPQTNVRSTLYCVTCKIRICDSCNSSFSSDQLTLFKETDKPFYCKSCNDLYPCKICRKQCYNDIVHAPSIYCDSCNEWLHHACSKLTYRQFNKLGKGNLAYICHVCMAENVPFAKLSKRIFNNTVVEGSPNTKDFRMNTPVCTLCVECNQSCDECQTCIDLYRVCDGCSSGCRYVTVGEYNNQLVQSSSTTNQLKLVHINI